MTWIQENYAERLHVEELASRVGMGVSTLHKHFREMTSMTPLNYQKQLRLLEARRLLVMEMVDATTVAFRVGYESASQFNREYRRMFGDPPVRSATALRARLLSTPSP
jgi:transcriptional regulator GlxA family with amidase domain